jgi:hypothetical protein
MTRPGILCLLVASALFAGCRTKPYVNAHIESVNAEYRELEDYVYSLEEENARLQQEMDALKSGRVDRTRTDAPASDGGLFRRRSVPAPARGTPAPTPPRIEAGPADEPPSIEIPSTPSTRQRPGFDEPAPDGLDLAPPSIDIPPPGDAPAEDALPSPAAPISRPEAIPARPASLSGAPLDRQVTQLHLNPLLTGGADLDGQPGDDGLSLVIEPRNAADQYVPEAGAISVVVLDPTLQGEAARVGRWDFDATMTRQLLTRTSVARGIQLDLPWPASPPASKRLHLYVRYETSDGEKVQADREITLADSDEVAGRWTPRPPERQRPAVAVTEVAEAANQQAAHAAPLAAAEGEPNTPPAELSSEASNTPPRPVWSPHR